jgi:hypothetical protein
MRMRAVAAALGLLFIYTALPVRAASSDDLLDTRSVYALLDVIDAIMAAHPDYEAEA